MEYIEDTTALVVDDSEFFASLAADQLRKNHDMTATTARSGEQALEELQRLDADIVVSDYDMPDMDGLVFYERVAEEYPDLPFILLTGRSDDDIAGRAIDAGIDDYLRKESVAEGNNFEVLANRIDNVVSTRKSRQKYELVVDNTPDTIAQVREDGTIMAANETAAETFDTTVDGLVGGSLDEVLPADVANRWLAYGDDALATSEVVSFETSYDDRHYHTKVVPVTVGGETNTVQVIARDITDRVAYEQQLEETTEELELINRFVRHDIRNDINLVSAWAELLEEHVDEEGQQYIDQILATSEHITELTQIAQEFVETVSGSGDPELKRVPLDRELGEEIQKCRESYDDATFRVDGEVPAVDVTANGMLGSVFRNLLNNAVQHNDSEHPQVYVTTNVGEETVTVTVADDGPGIPEDRRDEIFGKGAQGADSSGSGIGLYLVYTLVEGYGGDVWVADSDIGGTRVVVELPRA